jgi:hypothetical protein
MKAIRTINVFTGKEKQHSENVLQLLYYNGPLSAWELAGKLSSVGSRITVHATLNKRLRALEKKGYLQRENEKWYLLFKGIIAVLIIQKKPKIWNPIWKEIFDSKIETIQAHLAPIFGVEGDAIKDVMKRLGLSLESFDALVTLSERIKGFMGNGVDFDTIKIETLLMMVNLEHMDSSALFDAWAALWGQEQENIPD